MRETIVIERRFRGPPASANGGYACGLLAELVGGPAESTLRAPPPLDVPLDVERGEGGRVVCRHGDVVVGEAVPTTLALDVPAPVDLSTAAEAARGYVGFARHPFPGCFVCGPERGDADGLRIFPGAVPGRPIVAAPWLPDPSLADEAGLVRPAIVWAALDCPSWFGMAAFEGGPVQTALLGRLAAELEARPRAGEPCVATGWLIAREGRKIICGSALFDARGQRLAQARATWVTLQPR